MSKYPVVVISGEIMEEAPGLTLAEMAGICGLPVERIVEYVDLGVLEPAGATARQWRFPADSVPRLLKAARLQRDLGVDASSLALVLDLLDEMDRLRSRLNRLCGPFGE